MDSSEVLLELLGREFKIKSSPDKIEQLNAAVKLLKHKVNHVSDNMPHQGFDRTVVLAALTLAADYIELQNDKFNPQQELVDRMKRIQAQIARALTADAV